ncbi:fibrobacter succinogenes major paralogous domain-containing protein [candidate division KSB1 bacterium]|nr:fibrobacter succinogenes major paralogous domain-containing protein [candidate division KSB1 bacterium]
MRSFFIITRFIFIVVLLVILACDKKSPTDRTEVPEKTVTDIDGNIYHTVTIGTQTWTVENLQTTKYNDGTGIPKVTGTPEWGNLSIGAYCLYNNGVGSSYGYLYNWYAVDDNRNIAPSGWHVPSDAEWQILVDFLGGSDIAGDKMKDTTSWIVEVTYNESGFSALPGGYRNGGDGSFDDRYINAYFWSATEGDNYHALLRSLDAYSSGVSRSNLSKHNGFSVRLIQD